MYKRQTPDAKLQRRAGKTDHDADDDAPSTTTPDEEGTRDRDAKPELRRRRRRANGGLLRKTDDAAEPGRVLRPRRLLSPPTWSASTAFAILYRDPDKLDAEEKPAGNVDIEQDASDAAERTASPSCVLFSDDRHCHAYTIDSR
ncbi:hypothetical protein U9M48_003817 [Paspalum notatum var. saurae]|uniref:Uncharacterized protein n=1 Tax=Paspalum notatum var. saurae TaxID=547442 RepID=A0AAQ3PJM6_PASNO